MLAMRMEDWDKAVACFEAALKQNPLSVSGCYCLAASLHQQLQLVQAIDVYHRLLALLQNSPASNSDQNRLRGEVWASVGHCALLLDDLAKGFSAFQQALQILGSPKDAAIWFAIGLLYDRYGADELAREAFLITLKYEQENQRPGEPISMRQREIYYRLGLIYMNLKRWELSRECFLFSMDHPPAGLGREDVGFYIGVLHSIQGDTEGGRVVFERIGGKVVNGSVVPPTHEVDCSRTTQLKSRQILGWYEALCNGPEGVPRALSIAQAAVDEEPAEGFGWYCIGRIHMLNKDYTKAYDAYQQAVYRDGTNASFWNSIGILYFDIGQYRDALDAYSRSIHLAPFVADTWWNLGVLYETSHKQYDDALDAYNRAAELDPESAGIQERLTMFKAGKVMQPGSLIKPVEYCPMPFFSRPVILGKTAVIPPQRPVVAGHANPMSASSLNAQPIMHDQQQKSLQVAALLQQSRMAQIPPSFAARNTGLSSGNAAFSLPTPGPNQGLMQPRHQTYQQPIGPRPVGNVYSHQQPGSMSKFRQ
jgi:tetratricopeptide (TPR) repeat protein